jgi:S-DNA-T family DNA segregation ATPase FtsK/SpoIIIE
VVAATCRPSFDIIPTSLRDLFGYRAAFRCTTPTARTSCSGTWTERGCNAMDIPPTNQGAYLLAEGGTRLVKGAYLSDAHITAVADYAAWTRRPHTLSATDACMPMPARPEKRGIAA